MSTARRQPNRFDNDAMPQQHHHHQPNAAAQRGGTTSVNTSLSSVGTEAAHVAPAEPSARRRVPSPANCGIIATDPRMSPVDTSTGSAGHVTLASTSMHSIGAASSAASMHHAYAAQQQQLHQHHRRSESLSPNHLPPTPHPHDVAFPSHPTAAGVAQRRASQHDHSLSSVTAAPQSPVRPMLRSAVQSPTAPTPSGSARGGGSPLNASARKNNPYMYNVLGDNASPDFASRTSPLPTDESEFMPVPRDAPTLPPSSQQQPLGTGRRLSAGSPFDTTTATATGLPSPVVTGRGGPPPRNLSMEWGDDPQQQPGGSEPSGSPVVLGGYMAQCYSSAFPPGALMPRPMAADGTSPPAAAVATGPSSSSATSSAKEGGGGRRRNKKQQQHASAAAATSSNVASPSAPEPRSANAGGAAASPGTKPLDAVDAAKGSTANSSSHPSAATAQPSSSPAARVVGGRGGVDVVPPTASMTRVYRNGRPVPISAAATSSCA